MSQTPPDYAPPPLSSRLSAAVFDRRNIPLLSTVLVCAGIYAFAAASYPGFGDAGTFISFFGRDVSYLGISAVGMTFVILSGGIDLSVGSVIALSTVLVAVLSRGETFAVGGHAVPAVPPAVAIAVVLAVGTAFGAGQGWLIHAFKVPAFLTTLAGLFLARGLAKVIAPRQVGIAGRLYDWLTVAALPLGHDSRHRLLSVPIQGLALFAVVAVGFVVARFTRFGRTAYAVGGNEQSAVLMGLPVGRTKVGVYAVSGFCAALAGVVYTVDSSAGNADYALGSELDVIAAVVVGGTVLTGGVGSVVGTLFGYLTFSVMQSALLFNGNVVSAWRRIAVGGLLLAFILLQKAVSRRGGNRRAV